MRWVALRTLNNQHANLMSDSPQDLPDDSLIAIADSEIDASAIMESIRSRITKRRAEMGYDTTRFPTYGQMTYPEKPADIVYDPDLYHHLHLVNKLYADVETEPLLAGSAATRVPVLGKLWSLIRGNAHNLVLFYVNRGITHQVEVNRHLVNTLNLVVADNQRQERELVALRAELEALKEQG